MWGLLILELALTWVGLNLVSLHYIHMLQLESYQPDGYMRHLMRYKAEWQGVTLITGLVCLAAQLILPTIVFPLFTGERVYSMIISRVLIIAFYAVMCGREAYRFFTAKPKKPLVYTKRCKRLIAANAAVTLLCVVLLALIAARFDSSDRQTMLMWVSPMALIAALPFIVYLSSRAILPVENRINEGFKRASREKLAKNPKLIKVAITGSFGKTGTKYALGTILEGKYKTYISPGSTNTPMGLCTVINNRMPGDVQVFLAEMGSRHVGDIKELTQIVAPDVALITSVGAQHLETFGNVETVAKAKYELIEALGKKGKAFFASDGAWVDKMYEMAACQKFLSGLENPACDMWAENIETGAFGSRFELVTKDGQRQACETEILGRHNLSNVVLSALAAREMGLSLEEISAGISRLKPVEHRLQLIKGDINVLDDAFNSNPVGAKEALRILSCFPGRHLVVTPGFVEMGADEEKYNFELGGQIAEYCDAAILVGKKHTAPIMKGLLKAGFNRASVIQVGSLDEGSRRIREFISSGDAVLFENDLPDNYNEN
ncbi:MAG: UDP-N-acetylmuramoyl-tripeptide--D-alanyl-D-alanine ligase [Clostridia bacterium]|nr:UDP-N-acetylmuramoyl-tripeptide--D-alanyl-D-alanine ligase [Clostridia bacterium]